MTTRSTGRILNAIIESNGAYMKVRWVGATITCPSCGKAISLEGEGEYTCEACHNTFVFCYPEVDTWKTRHTFIAFL